MGPWQGKKQRHVCAVSANSVASVRVEFVIQLQFCAIAARVPNFLKNSLRQSFVLLGPHRPTWNKSSWQYFRAPMIQKAKKESFRCVSASVQHLTLFPYKWNWTLWLIVILTYKKYFRKLGWMKPWNKYCYFQMSAKTCWISIRKKSWEWPENCSFLWSLQKCPSHFCCIQSN